MGADSGGGGGPDHLDVDLPRSQPHRDGCGAPTTCGAAGAARDGEPSGRLIPAPFSVELPGVGPIGMRWDGEYAITVIALYGREYAETVLVPEGVDTVDTVPLEACGALLEQFGGLELHSVDVVSDGTRTAPNGWFTPRYDEIISDRSAVGMRRTWLVLRLCPQACLKAIAYRGSVAEAAAAATERIRQAAVRAGCRAVTCSPEQIIEATEALLDHRELAAYQERWADLAPGRRLRDDVSRRGCGLDNPAAQRFVDDSGQEDNGAVAADPR